MDEKEQVSAVKSLRLLALKYEKERGDAVGKLKWLTLDNRKNQATVIEGLRSLALEEHSVFIRMVCESELNIGNAESNVFAVYRSPTDDDKRIYQDLARILLSRIESSNKICNSEGYILLADYVSVHIDPKNMNWDIFEFGHKDPNVFALVNRYFESKKSDLGWALANAYELAYHGLPFYYLSADGGYEQLSFEDPDYVHLSKMGENCIQISTTGLPDWAKKYYIKVSHMDAHELFFGHGGKIEPRAIPALRRCIHDQIGITDSDARPDNGYHKKTELLKRVYEVTAEFGRQSPYPKAETVVSWLQKKHALSKRQAEAIEIIARPDNAR